MNCRPLLAILLFVAVPLLPAQEVVTADVPVEDLLSPEELEELVAPIALHPDALVALILPSATNPSDVVLAARRLATNPDPASLDTEPWDDSVRALAHYPEIVKWMDENLEWTQELGDAFVLQPADVMNAIQRLRSRARAAGTLTDTPQQQVIVEDDVVRILPARQEVIYVPRYDPEVVYVSRPVYYPTSYISFGIGYGVGHWLSYDCDWPRRTIWSVPPPHRARHWHERRDWRHPGFPRGRHDFKDHHWHAWRPHPHHPRHRFDRDGRHERGHGRDFWRRHERRPGGGNDHADRPNWRRPGDRDIRRDGGPNGPRHELSPPARGGVPRVQEAPPPLRNRPGERSWAERRREREFNGAPPGAGHNWRGRDPRMIRGDNGIRGIPPATSTPGGTTPHVAPPVTPAAPVAPAAPPPVIVRQPKMRPEPSSPPPQLSPNGRRLPTPHMQERTEPRERSPNGRWLPQQVSARPSPAPAAVTMPRHERRQFSAPPAPTPSRSAPAPRFSESPGGGSMRAAGGPPPEAMRHGGGGGDSRRPRSDKDP